MLKRLEEFFDTEFLTSMETYNEVLSSILFFRVFTGRTIPKNETMDNSEFPTTQPDAYIRARGFKFKKRLYKVEQSYQNLYHELTTTINQSINNYIKEHKIKLKTINYFSEIDLLKTNYEEWCDQFVHEENAKDKEDLIKHMSHTIESNKSKFKKLDKKKKHVIKYYHRCKNKTKENINILKKTYGDHLDVLLEAEDDINIKLQSLENKIVSIEKNLQDNINSLIDSLERNNTENNYILNNMQSTIVAEVNEAIALLEERIQVEFELEKKFFSKK